MHLSLVEVAAAIGGATASGPSVEVTTYHTDSRQVVPGGLFFALKRAESDGHRLVGDAAARGAAAVVGDRAGGAGAGRGRGVRRPGSARPAAAREALSRGAPRGGCSPWG